MSSFCLPLRPRPVIATPGCESNVKEIFDKCHELTADYVILGRPQETTEQNVFTHEQLDQFGLHIEQETRAKVIYPSGDGQ